MGKRLGRRLTPQIPVKPKPTPPGDLPPDRVDNLLDQLRQEAQPQVPPARQILADVRGRIAPAGPPWFAGLDPARLSASLTVAAILLGFSVGVFSREDRSQDTVLGIRDSLHLNVFEANALGGSYESLFGP